MNDEEMDLLIGRILRWGVSLSAAVVLAGGIWYLLEHGESTPPYSHFVRFHGLKSLLALPAPELTMLAGLLLLIATPVARVAFSLVAFAMERDRLYVVFTAIVLAVLVASIASAL